MPNLDEIKKKMTENITRIAIIIGAIIFFIVIYSIVQIARRQKNCDNIETYGMDKKIKTLTEAALTKNGKDIKLNDVYVKTAYNCCCSGDFNNDYVDTCALSQCAKQKVRALHFDIYSLNNRPVIATSSVKGNTYKETYNSLDLYSTMDNVKNNFMNIADPLFLIFCVNSKISTTYESMYSILVEIFGTGNITGNKIYLTNDIGNAALRNLMNKVIICVEAFDTPTFYSSSLALITSLDLNGTNKIYRESDILDLYSSNQPPYDSTYPQVLFPNKQKSSNNYDFITTGVKYGITFIGMNFQTNDNNLNIYNKGFANKTSSFISKTNKDEKGYYVITTFT
jgi:hypothetical protein